MHYSGLFSSNTGTSSYSSVPNPGHAQWGNDTVIQRTGRYQRRGLCLFAVLVVATSASISALLWLPDVTHWQQNELSHPRDPENKAAEIRRCGQTPSEGTASGAKALGCVYDIVSGSWVFPECHDRELEDEFLAYEVRWQWWADEGRMKELSVEEIRATGGVNPTGYFVTPEYHDYHCAFTWRKLHRAMQGNKLIDEHVGSMRHTNHCSSTMYRDRTDEPELAHFDLIFSGCMKL